MKATPIPLHDLCAPGIEHENVAQIVGAGGAALLDEPLLGLIAPSECPGNVFLATLESVP